MRKLALCATVTALLTGLALQFCESLAWNVIASMLTVVLITTLDELDA